MEADDDVSLPEQEANELQDEQQHTEETVEDLQEESHGAEEDEGTGTQEVAVEGEVHDLDPSEVERAPVEDADTVEESAPEEFAAAPGPAPPPSFQSVDERTRTDGHTKLRAYEARRRSAYTSKLESSSLYWRSFRDLLQASVQETTRAERLVVGTAKAHQAYADAMHASYEDGYLDDKGNVVLDPKRQRRLVEQRAILRGDVPSDAVKTEKKHEFSEERRISILSSLMDSQLVMSERYGENAKHLSAEIAMEITRLRQELQAKVSDIQSLGDCVIAELERTETEVAEAWDAYYAMAVKALGGSRKWERTAISSETVNESTTLPFENCTDVWVVEMHYRVSVAYQSSAWEKGSAELSTLFATMKEMECRRRIDLREYLVAFVQRQERLFLSLSDVYTPVLKDLVGRDMERTSIEEKLQTTIRKRAETLQREEAKNKAPAKKAPGLTGINDTQGKFSLESPLTSELLCKAKVIEKKTTGMMSSWKTTLAIVTADSFLHLFDLSSSRVQSGSAPEVAFQALVPTVKIPTAETLKSGKTNFVKGWCENLTPSESLVLPNCTVTSGLSDTAGSTFEITETIQTSGASKMFGKTTSRKVTLRTLTRNETEDWVAALKAQKYFGS